VRKNLKVLQFKAASELSTCHVPTISSAAHEKARITIAGSSQRPESFGLRKLKSNLSYS